MTDEDCPFSHDERKLTEAQLQTRRKALARNNNDDDDLMEEDLPDYEDTFEEDQRRYSGSHGKYSNMARNTRKRPRLVDYPDTTSNSMDTSNFPEPVPAVRSRSSRERRDTRSYSDSPREDSRRSGNARGAQGYRSDLVTPERRDRRPSTARGSSANRGFSIPRGSNRGGQSYSPRGSARRDPRRRWDRPSELRREEYEDRDRRKRW